MRVLLILILVAGTVCLAEAETDATASAVSADPPVEKTGAEDGIRIQKMVFCTGVKDRQPVGADTVFSNTVERIYCLTRVVGAKDTTSVTHVWYRGDKEMARVKLPVKSASWRTWSSKRIWEKWTGKWRVDVVGEGGEVVGSRGFVVR